MTVGFGNMKIDGMFSYRRLELSSFAHQLSSTITYQLIRYAEVRNELLQCLTDAALVLHQVCGSKERLISKDLCMFVPIARFVMTIHSVHVNCTVNARSYKHPVHSIPTRQWEYGRMQQLLCGDLERLCHRTQSNVPCLAKI